MALVCVDGSKPSTLARPEVGLISPSSMRMSVDLPDPLRPSKAATQPRGTSKLTESAAHFWPK